MCGRYGADITGEHLAILLDLPLPQCAAQTPRWNIAPTQRAPVARLDASGARQWALLSWGLIPSWSTDDRRRASLINARSESAQEKPSFREAFLSRRCVVVADGFYEWRRAGRRRIPTHFQLRGGAPHGLAGLWESWRDPATDLSLETFTILTCPANERVAPIHHRMPVILSREDFSSWLDPRASTLDLQELLRPYPADAMESWEVTERVNAVAYDDRACRLPPLRLL